MARSPFGAVSEYEQLFARESGEIVRKWAKFAFFAGVDPKIFTLFLNKNQNYLCYVRDKAMAETT